MFQQYSYKVGEEVEVMITEPGFENFFFPARVVSKEGPSSYKVAYDTLVTEDRSTQLEEFAFTDQLRPKPPHVSVVCFSLHESADVYEGDGWWAGLIDGKFMSEYFLFHSATGMEKSYLIDRFRVHHEWKDGRWICHKAFP